MGKKHRKKVACGACKRGFGTEHAVWTHIAFQHSSSSGGGRHKAADGGGGGKMSSAAARPVFSCSGCHARFDSDSDLTSHIDQEREEEKKKKDVKQDEHKKHHVQSQRQEEDSHQLQNASLEPEKDKDPSVGVSSTCSSFKIHCALCRKRFKSENALWTHIAFKHSRHRAADSAGVHYICDNCKQVFETIDLINQHCRHQLDNCSVENSSDKRDSSHSVKNSSDKTDSSHSVDNSSDQTDSSHSVKNSSNQTDSSHSVENSSHKTDSSHSVDNSSHKTDSSHSVENSSDKTESSHSQIYNTQQPEIDNSSANKVVPSRARKSLDDSFEGQEGIQVVYDEDNENDDFDDFEDEEYSKIDDILHSRDIPEPEASHNRRDINLLASNSRLPTQFPDDLDKDGNANETTPEIVIDDELEKDSDEDEILADTELAERDVERQQGDDAIEDSSVQLEEPSKVDEMDEEPSELDASNSSKELSLSDLLEDEAEFHNKITLLSSMFTNELLTSRVRYLESKVAELQEYMSKLLEEEEEEENKTDHSKQTDFTSHRSELSCCITTDRSKLSTDRSKLSSDKSDISSLSCEDSTGVSCDGAFIMSLDSNKIEPVPLQCDKIESTTGSYDLSGELVTFTEDSVCEEVEINTSNSEEDSRDAEVTEVIGENKISKQFSETAVNLGQTYQCSISNAVSEDDQAQDTADSSHIFNVEGLDSSTTLIVSSDDSTELGIVLSGEAVTNVVTILDSADVMEDDTAMDSVVFEQIRNGHISCHELDSLFTSGFSESQETTGEPRSGDTDLEREAAVSGKGTAVSSLPENKAVLHKESPLTFADQYSLCDSVLADGGPPDSDLAARKAAAVSLLSNGGPLDEDMLTGNTLDNDILPKMLEDDKSLDDDIIMKRSLNKV